MGRGVTEATVLVKIPLLLVCLHNVHTLTSLRRLCCNVVIRASYELACLYTVYNVEKDGSGKQCRAVEGAKLP